MHRLAKPGARQRAAGDEQQRDQAARVAFGAIVPDVAAGGDRLQTRTRRGLPPGGIQIGRELDQSCAADLNQLGVKPIQQVEGRYQLGHDTQLGRERPRLGHRSLHRSTGPIKQIDSRSSLLSESAPAPRSISQCKAFFDVRAFRARRRR
jgi:hypothetical protein